MEAIAGGADPREKLRLFVDDLRRAVQEKARRHEREAASLRRWDVTLKALSAVLAVAAPALVTYQPVAQQDVLWMSQDSFRILVIFLVGFAGASVTLQAVFSFHKKYANARMTAAKLSELEERLGFDLLVSDLGSPHEAYAILRRSIEEAVAERSGIVMKYVEGDINTILTSTEDLGKRRPPDAGETEDGRMRLPLQPSKGA